MADIANNYRQILSRIEEAASGCGRNPGDIQLIPVSKTRSSEEIEAAYDAGIRLFGENRVQEISTKFIPLPHMDMQVHMIGALQSNKVKTAVQACSWIHSAEREKTLRLISKYAVEFAKTVNVCIEINTSGEESKHGLENRNELFALMESSMDLPGINLRGLMTVGPLMSDGEAGVRTAFEDLSAMFDAVKTSFDPPHWDSLSMGMSNDFELAIECGATMVRVGTAIFGERSYDR